MKAALIPKRPFQERLEIGDTIGNGSGITISRATNSIDEGAHILAQDTDIRSCGLAPTFGMPRTK
jgi:hypothetical protein